MYKVIGAALLVVGMVVLVSLLTTLPTMWCWNWLMPKIFELTTITFWEALGLNVLCGCLFQSKTSNSSK